MEAIVIFIIALLIDIASGEPSNYWHPVAWLGKIISLQTRIAPKQCEIKRLVFGIITVLLTLAAMMASAYFLLSYKPPIIGYGRNSFPSCSGLSLAAVAAMSHP